MEELAEILAWAEQDGVDVSMLRERLQWTPTERLQRHQVTLALVEALRNAKRKVRRAPAVPDVRRRAEAELKATGWRP